jgi:hypothetical protein
MTTQTHLRRLLSVLAAFAFLLIPSVGNATASEDDGIQWQQIRQLCGSILSVVPVKKVVRRPNGKSETLFYANPMKRAAVTLYRADNQSAVCCSVAAKVGEIVTDAHGRFTFADYAGGYYWLVVQFNGGEAKVPVQADKYDKHACEAPNVHRIIFADASPKPKVEVRII